MGSVTLQELRQSVDRLEAGKSMIRLMEQLYPICRSLTGQGVRDTLALVREEVPDLVVHSVASGEPVFDWTVPPEWNIAGAHIKDPSGKVVVDFSDSPLHVVSYSTPVRRTMPLQELAPHLHSLSDQPDAIPYRTSYYEEAWGFCLPHRLLESLEDGLYEVVIDSTLEDGVLNYGELILPGELEADVLISTHICHPAQCNDNLSGIVVAAHLAKLLSTIKTRFTYRFVFVPAGIGSIIWLYRNEDVVPRIAHGLALACLGDRAGFTYKLSRRGDAPIDAVAELVLRARDDKPEVVSFDPYGFDRNFSSPAFDVPMGSLTRSLHERYPEYHSSDDDLTLMDDDRLGESLDLVLEIFEVLEGDGVYQNLSPKGEPQLGKRGLYGGLGGLKNRADVEMALLWVLNLSDGGHSLVDICRRSGLSFEVIRQAADLLEEHQLLARVA